MVVLSMSHYELPRVHENGSPKDSYFRVHMTYFDGSSVPSILEDESAQVFDCMTIESSK